MPRMSNETLSRMLATMTPDELHRMLAALGAGKLRETPTPSRMAATKTPLPAISSQGTVSSVIEWV